MRSGLDNAPATAGQGAPTDQRASGGFSPQETSPANGSINVRSTTGQSSAASTTELSSEQRSKIATIFRQHKVGSVDLDIPVRLGAQVPPSVHYYPVPTDVVEVYPEWRGYDYIMVGDETLIIDPHTHEIVAILVA